MPPASVSGALQRVAPAAVAPGLARVVALLRPGTRGAGGAYRSGFLRRLRLGRAALVVLVLAGACLALSASAVEQRITRTIGTDTKASVVAAERIRTGLARAHAAVLASVVLREGEDGAWAMLARQRIGEVMDALADAAKNITYGAQEQNPIDTVLRGIADYAAEIGRARVETDPARPSLMAADRRMEWTLLPAAAALDRVNADRLDQAFRERQGLFGLAAGALVLVGAAIGLLVHLQLVIRARTRRQVSPWLALATLVLCAGTAGTLFLGIAGFGEIRVAKQDAFDSIGALWNARSTAANAEAAVNAALAAGDGAGRAALRESYRGRSLTVLAPEAPPAPDGTPPFRGLLGEELANITFPGEGEAAKRALDAWLRFDAAERAILDRADGTDARAVAAQTGPKGSGEALFQAFDAALADVIAVNDAAFEAAIAAAHRDAALADVLIPLTAALAIGLALLGLKRRIDEYRA